MELYNKYIKLKRALFEKCYASLNSKQREAIFHVNGPLLILAGAGSGKTTVLVKRVVFIIKYGDAYWDETIPDYVDEKYISEMEEALNDKDISSAEDMLQDFACEPCRPYRMLAITFTNKAANEIKSRLASALDDEDAAKDIWAGTFHSICMRILRANCTLIGYEKEFTIYDADDTKKAISAAMKRCNIDEKQFPIKSVINTISRAKDRLLSPEAFEAEAASDFRLSKISRIYAEYQKTMRASNAMDFDDIIVNTVKLFKENPDVLEFYRKKFRYVCVDEYQDTNEAQFVLTALIAGGFGNLMVVGDDDQSIYKFRGATIGNILNFDKHFSDAKVIKLEQNYRSTSTILDAANAVIANNSGRKGKQLWTDGERGEKITVRRLEDENHEARDIADTVNKAVGNDGRAYRDFAILYRNNAQSNSIERALAKAAVPYRMLGGVRFTDRKEIRDAVAYLQLIANHADRERLLRIINEPRRKIGGVTLDAVSQIAAEQNTSLFDICERASEFTALSRSAGSLERFAQLINALTVKAKHLSLPDLFDAVLDDTGYRQMIIDAGEEEKDRLDNLEEFKSSIIEYVNKTEEPSLMGFLEENALVADVDRYDESADAVVLMTVHSAKGLEFPVVILPGFEDGIFPSMQTVVGSEDDMEEERRLAYVALTRAKEQIYIMYTKHRMLYGQTQANPLSRFVTEIPEQYTKREENNFGSGMYGNMYGGVKTYYSESRGGYIPQNVRTQQGTYGQANSYGQQRSTGNSTYTRKVGERPTVGGETTIGKPIFTQKPQGEKTTFKPGDRVKHQTFGEGEVLSARPMGADTLYEVIFDRVGTKKLMATYAKLVKI